MVGDIRLNMYYIIIYDVFDRYYRHFCNSRMFGLNAYSEEIIKCMYEDFISEQEVKQ